VSESRGYKGEKKRKLRGIKSLTRKRNVHRESKLFQNFGSILGPKRGEDREHSHVGIKQDKVDRRNVRKTDVLKGG